jgi:hypothetical protein
MSIETLRNAQYKDLGETWYSHQAARIVQRHIQFGRHCSLDLDALLGGIARRIRRSNFDSAVNGEQHLPTDTGIADRRAARTREQTGRIEA